MFERWTLVCLLLGATTLTSCAARHAGQPPAQGIGYEASASGPDDMAPAGDDAVGYYIGKLPDQDYVSTYGGDDHPRPWYIAAEALGEIGKPAVPALIARLDTPDSHELKLALYALMLASQDPALRAGTQGDYLQLRTVLTEETNDENRRRALAWWERYGHLWR